MGYSFDELRSDYERELADFKLTRPTDTARLARHLLGLMDRYAVVAAKTDIPAVWLAVIDYRESDNDLHTYLGNGEPIIATGRKTKLVPRGRGPFATWEVGAIDALAYMDLVGRKIEWTLPYALWQSERWNGFGARKHGVPSGYLWAGTSVYKGGGYPSDGEWDPKHEDKELGVAPLLQLLGHLDAQYALSEA